ncbi:flippase-like domain-containing protein [Hydrogenivirga sp.]
MIRKLLPPLLISLLFFFIFIHFVPLEELSSLIGSFSWTTLTGAFILYTLSQITRSLRWKLLLKGVGILDAFMINSANIFLNNLLPARTGELSWFYYAHRLGVEIKSSAWSFFIGRFYDLLGLLFLLFLSYTLLESWLLFFAGVVSVIAVVVALPLALYLIPSVGRLSEIRGFMRRELTHTLSLKLAVLSTLSFFFKALSVYILIKGFMETDLLGFSFAFAGGELTTILPIHGFMGYGTYEAGFLLPLKLMGEEIKEGLKLGFLAHTFLLFSSAVWGLIAIPLLHTRSRR